MQSEAPFLQRRTLVRSRNAVQSAIRQIVPGFFAVVGTDAPIVQGVDEKRSQVRVTRRRSPDTTALLMGTDCLMLEDFVAAVGVMERIGEACHLIGCDAEMLARLGRVDLKLITAPHRPPRRASADRSGADFLKPDERPQ